MTAFAEKVKGYLHHLGASESLYDDHKELAAFAEGSGADPLTVAHVIHQRSTLVIAQKETTAAVAVSAPVETPPAPCAHKHEGDNTVRPCAEASEAGEAAETSAPVLYEASPRVYKGGVMTKPLRWHRGDKPNLKAFAQGRLGVYGVWRQKPNRRKGVLAYALTLDSTPLKSFDSVADAKTYAQAYDEIAKAASPEPPAAPTPEGPACGPCAPVRIERDPAKHEACLAVASRLGPIDKPVKVYSLLHSWAQRSRQESFYVVPLNLRAELLCAPVEVARGQRSKVAIGVDDTWNAVIAAGAEKFWICHSHPSGKSKPSPADVDLTKDVLKATSVLSPDGRIACLGHVVIGAVGEFSALTPTKSGKLEIKTYRLK